MQLRPRGSIVPAAVLYDSVHLALAVHEGARLVTADKRLCNALLQTRLAGNVLWIGDTL